MLEQLLSPRPSEPDPASSAQESQVEWDLSVVAMVELSWSHWPHYHVIEEASKG